MKEKVSWILEQDVKDKNLLDAGKELKITLKSPCGGKGKCGKCIVQLVGDKVPEPTKQEEKLLKKEDLQEGIRLGCEVKMKEGLQVLPIGLKKEKDKKDIKKKKKKKKKKT